MINDTFILLKPGDNLYIRMSQENQICKPLQFLRGQYIFVLAHIQKNLTIIYLQGKKERLNTWNQYIKSK